MPQDILALFNETAFQLLMVLDGAGLRGTTRTDLLVTTLNPSVVKRYLDLFHELGIVRTEGAAGEEPRYTLDRSSTVLTLLLSVVQANNSRLFVKDVREQPAQEGLARDIEAICGDPANDVVLYKPAEKRFVVVKGPRPSDGAPAYVPRHPVSVLTLEQARAIKDKAHVLKGFNKVVAAALAGASGGP
jgi:hypothetical protein